MPITANSLQPKANGFSLLLPRQKFQRSLPPVAGQAFIIHYSIKMSKVTIVGAGNVGATCANVLAHEDICNEIVLIDIQGNMAKGKALDTWQQAPVDGYSSRVVGGEDYALTANSDIVIITAGLPRKPGMSRDDLISTNAKVVVSVTQNILKYTPNPIIIVVSNPLDVMTYACWKASGLSDKRVFGMAGVLDTARYRAFLAEEIGCSPKDISAILMGGHGDTMVPLPRYTTVSGIPVTELVAADKLDAIIERTKTGGGELVNLMGTSACLDTQKRKPHLPLLRIARRAVRLGQSFCGRPRQTRPRRHTNHHRIATKCR
jgi:malate dehydrogenase